MFRLTTESAHSNASCDHSYISPVANNMISVLIKISVLVGVPVFIAHGSGSNRAISKSNSRNKIAIRKNRIENGSRALLHGSNPHSYGDSFSEFGVCGGNQKLISINMVVNMVEIPMSANNFITIP